MTTLAFAAGPRTMQPEPSLDIGESYLLYRLLLRGGEDPVAIEIISESSNEDGVQGWLHCQFVRVSGLDRWQPLTTHQIRALLWDAYTHRSSYRSPP